MPGFGFFSALQISLKTSFPREPSYLISTTGSCGRYAPSQGTKTSKDWGEQEGRRVTLLQPHGPLQDFIIYLCRQKIRKICEYIKRDTFFQLNIYWFLSYGDNADLTNRGVISNLIPGF